MEVLGIDVGGTAIKLGRFDDRGNCLQSLTIDTPQPSLPEAVQDAILVAIPEIDSGGRAQAIGIGTPGPADRDGKIAILGINLVGWDHVPLGVWIETATGLPTVIANDANCAGVGEHWLGAARGVDNFILLTLGTGVGGAIFINGSLFTGSYGAAGELGLVSLRPDGPACRSGNQGSLEQHLSIGSIQTRTGKTPAELSALAAAGDGAALAFWRSYGRDLGIGLANHIYVLTPELIAIGGGICAASEFFLDAVWEEIDRRVVPSSRVGLKIVQAELGNQAGMVGAARLALDKFG
ncbi:MAG: ROK family protein [Alkalinema sp. RU_4_3]|nr:ROK family protein [Alkalinema sp. RU_4_3]